MEFTQFIGNLGGLFSFWVGASVLTICDLFHAMVSFGKRKINQLSEKESEKENIFFIKKQWDNTVKPIKVTTDGIGKK